MKTLTVTVVPKWLMCHLTRVNIAELMKRANNKAFSLPHRKIKEGMLPMKSWKIIISCASRPIFEETKPNILALKMNSLLLALKG